MEFAVLDFETTGLFPSRHDRVVEVAVVRVDEQGRTLAEFETLINAGRDVGPTHIHGIQGWELDDAPAFGAVIGDIFAMLDGAVLIAHNARFDKMFLSYELERAGCSGLEVTPFCTMELLHAIEPNAPRRLRECCDYLGLDVGTPHRALDDARMTAQLFTYLLGRWAYPALPEPSKFDTKLPRCTHCCPRGSTRPPAERQAGFLANLVSRLPGGAPTLRASIAGAEYLNLLDRALEDRLLSETEAELLVSVAMSYGLAAKEVAALHDDYMRQLVEVALDDGVITEAERRDLDAVSALLATPWEAFADVPTMFGLGASSTPRRQSIAARSAERAVAARTANDHLAARRAAADHLAAAARPTPLIPAVVVATTMAETTAMSGGLARGMSVCFTGTMEFERDDMQAIAAKAGLVVKSNVSGKLDVLVIADPSSQSGKARKARQLGVRLVSELAFLQMVGAR
jgi:DNA polymerase-3 subunit epsilon